jgi:hypothetical protein
VFCHSNQWDKSLREVESFISLKQWINPFNAERCCAVNPLKFKIPSKNMREKTTNTPIIHSVY